MTSTLLNGLVSHWKMDELSGTRYDSHGMNNLLVPFADPPSDVGKIGRAAKFPDNESGENWYELSTTVVAPLNIPDVAIAFWVKITETGENIQGPFVQSKAAGSPNQWDYEWQLFWDNGYWGAIVTSIDAGLSVFLKTNEITANEWHFVVISGTNNHLYFYVDNVLIGDQAHAVIPAAALYNITASYISVMNDVDIVWVDSFSLYSRVPTSDERTKLWNDGAGLDYPFESLALCSRRRGRGGSNRRKCLLDPTGIIWPYLT